MTEPLDRAEPLLAALARGDLVTARDLARRALADPTVDLRATHAVLGRLEAALGDEVSAISHFERALSLAPDGDPQTAQELAWLLRESDPSRAEALLAPLVSEGVENAQPGGLAPNTNGPELPSWIFVLLGDLAEQLHADPELACRHFRRGLAVTAPESPERAIVLGRLAVATPQPDEALAAAAELAELSPRVVEAEIYGHTLARLMRDGHAAPPLPERLLAGLELTPGGLLPAKKLQIQLARERGELKLARGLAEALRYAAPDDPELLRLRAELALLDGDLSLAGPLVVEAEAAGVLLPVDAQLAWADALRQAGRHDEAREVVGELVRRDPDHGGAWLELARLDVDRGREEDALGALRRAAELDPEVDLHAGRVHHLLRQVLGELPTLGALAGGAEIVRVRFGHNAIVIQLDTSAGERFLKCFLPGRRPRPHLEAVGALMNTLAVQRPVLQHPLALAEALPETSSAALVHRVGPTDALLMTAVPGLSLRKSLAHPRTHMHPAHARALGHAAAALGRALDKATSTLDPAHIASLTRAGLRSGALFALGWTAPAAWHAFAAEHGLTRRAPREVDALGAHLERLAEPLHALAAAPEQAPRLVHGDFGWHNVLWGEVFGEPVVTAVIDFDYAGLDLPLVDLANAILRTAFDWRRLDAAGDPRPRPELARALLDGFREGGGVLADDASLLALMRMTRIQYYTGLAATSIAAETERESPRGYNRAQDTLAVLLRQLDWLERHPADALGHPRRVA